MVVDGRFDKATRNMLGHFGFLRKFRCLVGSKMFRESLGRNLKAAATERLYSSKSGTSLTSKIACQSRRVTKVVQLRAEISVNVRGKQTGTSVSLVDCMDIHLQRTFHQERLHSVPSPLSPPPTRSFRHCKIAIPNNRTLGNLQESHISVKRARKV